MYSRQLQATMNKWTFSFFYYYYLYMTFYYVGYNYNHDLNKLQVEMIVENAEHHSVLLMDLSLSKFVVYYASLFIPSYNSSIMKLVFAFVLFFYLQECPAGTYKNVTGSDRALCHHCPVQELPHRAEYIAVRGTSMLLVANLSSIIRDKGTYSLEILSILIHLQFFCLGGGIISYL